MTALVAHSYIRCRTGSTLEQNVVPGLAIVVIAITLLQFASSAWLSLQSKHSTVLQLLGRAFLGLALGTPSFYVMVIAFGAPIVQYD